MSPLFILRFISHRTGKREERIVEQRDERQRNKLERRGGGRGWKKIVMEGKLGKEQ